jgi:hypothetical protein
LTPSTECLRHLSAIEKQTRRGPWRDCEQFLLKAPDKVLLFDAIAAWVLWNVFRVNPQMPNFGSRPFSVLYSASFLVT